MNWVDLKRLDSIKYTCGYCGCDIASEMGYCTFYEGCYQHNIRICHKCQKPSYIDARGDVTPSATYGKKINHLPDNIEGVYDEARKCFSVNAYTSAIMCCRKLLMHIACGNGAPENQSFGKYVQYLKDEGYVTRPSFGLADAILKYGNIANHQLEIYLKEDAVNIMLFTEAILKSIYELPNVYAELNTAR